MTPTRLSAFDQKPAPILHGLFRDFGSIDPRARRPPFAEVEDVVDRLGRAFEKSLYTSVAAVPHETREPEAQRLVSSADAKEHSLDLAIDADPTRDALLCYVAAISMSQSTCPRDWPDAPSRFPPGGPNGGSRESMLLSPRAARVLYNVLDAWFPPGDPDHPGAGDFDLLEATLRQLRPEECRGLEASLVLLDWVPRLVLRVRGYSALPRSERRRWLMRLKRVSPSPLQRRLSALHRAADSAYRDALASWRSQLSSPDP